MKRWLLGLLGWLTPLAVASAHTFAPTVITLSEEAPGRFRVETLDPPGVPSSESMVPRYPSHCRLGTESQQVGAGAQPILDCGALGLRGQQLAVTGPPIGEALLTIHFADGETLSALLHQEPLLIPSLAQPLGLPWSQTATRFLQLGFRHIVSGVDHLLLLLGLLVVVGSLRGLLLTVTAFTVGHSLTLALGTLDLVRPPPVLVEALIALSVGFVAREIVRPTAELGRYRPPLLAVLFGLLHGLGFASALREVGLPEGQLLLSLGAFNLGVELGQLLFVGALLLPVRWLHRSRYTPLVGYALGGVAMAWTMERSLVLFGKG